MCVGGNDGENRPEGHSFMHKERSMMQDTSEIKVCLRAKHRHRPASFCGSFRVTKFIVVDAGDDVLQADCVLCSIIIITR